MTERRPTEEAITQARARPTVPAEDICSAHRWGLDFYVHIWQVESTLLERSLQSLSQEAMSELRSGGTGAAHMKWGRKWVRKTLRGGVRHQDTYQRTRETPTVVSLQGEGRNGVKNELGWGEQGYTEPCKLCVRLNMS